MQAPSSSGKSKPVVFPSRARRSTDFVNTYSRSTPQRPARTSTSTASRRALRAMDANDRSHSRGGTPAEPSPKPSAGATTNGASESLSSSWAACRADEDPRVLGLGALLPALRDAEESVADEQGETDTGGADDDEEEEESSFISVTSREGSVSVSPFDARRESPAAAAEEKTAEYNPTRLNPKWGSAEKAKEQPEAGDSRGEFKPWEEDQGEALPRVPAGCYCTPSVEALRQMTADEQRRVPRLVIGKEGFGEIMFDGTTDVRGLDLRDEELCWEGKAGRCTGVELYPGDEEPATKPAQGCGLNKRATVTLNFRKNFSRRQLAKDIEAGGMGFVGYQPDTGILQFVVDHF